jgi:hypothetical protein
MSSLFKKFTGEAHVSLPPEGGKPPAPHTHTHAHLPFRFVAQPTALGCWTTNSCPGLVRIKTQLFCYGGDSLLNTWCINNYILGVYFQEIYRTDWMFKLVGKEHFQIGHSKAKCTITIDAVSGFAYEYTLEVNGKSLNKFRENQSKIQKAWVLTIAGNPIRVCLGESRME